MNQGKQEAVGFVDSKNLEDISAKNWQVLNALSHKNIFDNLARYVP